MKTTITRNFSGIVALEIEGDNAPEAVAQAFLKVEGMIFPKPEEEPETKPPVRPIKKEET